MIYIFKDKENNRHVCNESQAHSQIRNRGQWQRQDLVYLGGVNITTAQIQQVNQERRETALNVLISEDKEMIALKSKLELANLKKEDTASKILEAEIKVLENDIQFRVGITDGMTLKVEKTVKEYVAIINRLEKEYINSLEVDNKIIPRNFNSAEGIRLNGKEVGLETN